MYGVISRFASGKIRRIVLFGMILSVLGFSVLGAISYRYLLQIEDALALAEVVDDLSSEILEIRRYEKNYLLYALEEDYLETLRYCDKALSIIERIEPREGGLIGADLKGRVTLVQLRDDLLRYKELFSIIATQPGSNNDENDPQGVELRDQGKDLVDVVRQFVLYQRERILDIVGTLKHQLALAIGAFTGVAIFFSWLVGRRIFGALGIIEHSTRQIVQGNFKPLPLPDTSDETRGVVEAFNHMIEELERRQNQLLQEKKLASLGVLTSGIAHQLNNPLNNISTSCQILQEDLEAALPVDQALTRQMLDNIYQEVSRSRDIVKGLLEFARETEFCLKPVPLHAVVQRAVTLVSSEVPSGVRILTEIPDHIKLPLDSQRFQEVLLNLMINAIHAISPPGVISLSARSDPGSGEAVLQVTDTGGGISPEHLGRIFDPFFTLKDTGTGLGLSVVFGIIKKHGGTISVESRMGEGTTFTLHLPLGGDTSGAS
ncbi:Signal transduction histidine kinase [Desulfomicrobium apsheronum]|jgi:signal transduction histidine kinase|uniref:histidine kinase n=1 Tax=Desulfomicrobium apsheronum TaxID=52560 RepID=A0A1I3XIK0_9BACT|nr:ATP-binding protein [Desulfomicrobium apsheronum]SFK19437.1 Signal transduction histidine kinase [Desulfomicrobium apsheronum]